MTTPSAGFAPRVGFASLFASPRTSARQRWYAVVGACVLLLVAMVAPAPKQHLAFTGTQSMHGHANPSPAVVSRELSNLPASAQGPVSAALGKDDSSYWFHSNEDSVHAENPRHALALDFTRHGVEVSSHGARWGLALRGYGYGDERRTVKQADPQSKANRVEYERGAVTEWYINGPLGLEQGFTLEQPPGKAHGRPLTMALSLSGDSTASLDADGTAVTLNGRNGQAALRLAGLVAYDATGRELRGRFVLHGEELVLQVEDAGAQYPLVVDPFVQQAELTASDGATGDSFGYSVALSSDGNTALVGAPTHTVNGSVQGAAYVFANSDGSWSQRAELTASDGAAGDEFGNSVALSGDGNTALVGALYHSVNGNADQGSAYTFTNSGGSWSQQAELTASDGATDRSFGNSVALSGDGNTALVGAPYNTVNGSYAQGAAYVFANSGGSWSQQQELTASDGAGEDRFGWSVALSSDGNTALVGAPFKFGSNTYQGAAYVFTNSGGSWSQQELTASDGALDDFFGYSVALSGDGNTAAVGAPYHNYSQGAAYVFANSGGSWSQTQELTASDGVPGDRFGWSVALSSDGNTAVVGAKNKTFGSNIYQGAAYVFTNSGGSWSQQQELTASDGAFEDFFGNSVALSSDGNTALVGAYAKTVGSNVEQGAAYTFFNGSPTTTAIASNLNPSTYGQSVSFTATINGASGNVKGRSSRQGVKQQVLGGTVTWSDNTGCGTTAVTSGDPGVATCTTSSLSVGTDTITATYSGDSNNSGSTGTLSGGQVVNQASQTITFTTNAPASAAYNSSFTVAATGGASGNPVTFTSSGACSNSGATYTMTSGTGTCSVIADQAGNSNYAAAPTVTEITNATLLSQTIMFTTNAPANAAYNSSFTVAASASSGLAVAYTSAGSCSNSGATYTMTAPTGTCTVTASQSGDSNYLAATSVNESTTAKKATQIVTFTGAPATAYYQSSFTVATTQNSGITPTITASSACSITGDTATMTTGTGTCTLTATWPANSDYNKATATQKTIAQRLAPAVTFTGAPTSAPYLSTFTVATTQNSGITPTIASTTGAVCSVSSGTITMKKGTGTCAVKASWAPNSDYLPASLTQSTTATLLGTTTTITSTVPQTNPLKVAVYFTVSNGTSTAVTGNVTVTAAPGGETCTGSVTIGKCLLTFTAAGSQTLTAVYAGNTNDATSTSAPYSLTVQ